MENIIEKLKEKINQNVKFYEKSQFFIEDTFVKEIYWNPDGDEDGAIVVNLHDKRDIKIAPSNPDMFWEYLCMTCRQYTGSIEELYNVYGDLIQHFVDANISQKCDFTGKYDYNTMVHMEKTVKTRKEMLEKNKSSNPNFQVKESLFKGRIGDIYFSDERYFDATSWVLYQLEEEFKLAYIPNELISWVHDVIECVYINSDGYSIDEIENAIVEAAQETNGEPNNLELPDYWYRGLAYTDLFKQIDFSGCFREVEAK